MARNSRLTTPFSNEDMDRCIKTFGNTSRVIALGSAINRAVGRDNGGRSLPAAGTAKEWLTAQGYTRERGFFYEDFKAYKEWRANLNVSDFTGLILPTLLLLTFYPYASPCFCYHFILGEKEGRYYTYDYQGSKSCTYVRVQLP